LKTTKTRWLSARKLLHLLRRFQRLGLNSSSIRSSSRRRISSKIWSNPRRQILSFFRSSPVSHVLIHQRQVKKTSRLSTLRRQKRARSELLAQQMRTKTTTSRSPKKRQVPHSTFFELTFRFRRDENRKPKKRGSSSTRSFRFLTGLFRTD
jgi:hypothetical protein